MEKLSRIEKLPTAVANQIAAGEVVERPFSVVKELLENALDANATTIIIDIGFGGLNQIKIADDGDGIVEEDLILALSPHATSKIRNAEDLYAIHSMGFRGEALASIASVSRLSISSKPEKQALGMMIDNQDYPLKPKPFPRSKGTTIEVRDLFYTTPVRKKFLKSEQSEFQAIEALVKRFALTAFEVRIQLNHNGKTILDLPKALDKTTRLARIKKIFGKNFLESAIVIEAEHPSLKLFGFISNEDYQRSQNDKLWVYLNRRMVKDKLLHHAIKQAYEDLLHPGRYPTCLLYLTMSAEEVDVNVHPTKHEVRFQQPRLVHDFLFSALNAKLNLKPKREQVREPIFSPIKSFERRDLIPRHCQQNECTFDFDWTPLSKEFAFVRYFEHFYLLNMGLAYKKYLRFLLEKATYPLASRPLLVPLMIDIDKPFDNLAAFFELGFHLEPKDERQWRIRAIPLLAPYTNLIPFIKKGLESSDLLSLLVEYQTLEAHHLNDEERQSLLDYIHQNQDASSKVWISLSDSFCRALFND